MLWPHGKPELDNFITHVNQIHPTIKFTANVSGDKVAFLDTLVSIKNNKLRSNIPECDWPNPQLTT